ncbi:hypothetical protein [Nocardia lijiangensis]|uniref:hypothetical protein n=1 Tax=Nocardia lijiangensis TaxID=299618 RepID=UPI0012DF4035|nr:hypothetical protein [Nocardia lijiangensis]
MQRRGNSASAPLVIGPLVVTREVLMPMRDPDQRIVIYRPVNADSQAALNRRTAGVAAKKPRAAELSPPRCAFR